MSFEERKAKALQKLQERMVKLQEKQACVNAATTPDALKACFPNWGEHKGKRGKGHGEGRGRFFNNGHHGENNAGGDPSNAAPGQQKD